MKGLEKIIHQNKTFAIILRQAFRPKEREFFTLDKNPLQFGIHSRGRGERIGFHKHLLKRPLKVSSIQEFLFLRKGKVRVDFFEENDQKIKSVVLKTGDGILILEGGHGIEFLESSELLEVKQGPFLENSTIKLKSF
ncbi:hypothetical protein HYS91_03135 [Candidatus Daviesbacteria bacterium]|nr:hypothetical protein [Candidatus Daviesbacteria bacterium]